MPQGPIARDDHLGEFHRLMRAAEAVRERARIGTGVPYAVVQQIARKEQVDPERLLALIRGRGGKVDSRKVVRWR